MNLCRIQKHFYGMKALSICWMRGIERNKYENIMVYIWSMPTYAICWQLLVKNCINITAFCYRKDIESRMHVQMNN